MNPEDRTGALLVFTLCVAALTLVLWIEWLSSQSRGLFAPAASSFLAADTAVAEERAPKR